MGFHSQWSRAHSLHTIDGLLAKPSCKQFVPCTVDWQESFRFLALVALPGTDPHAQWPPSDEHPVLGCGARDLDEPAMVFHGVLYKCLCFQRKGYGIKQYSIKKNFCSAMSLDCFKMVIKTFLMLSPQFGRQEFFFFSRDNGCPPWREAGLLSP